MQVVLGAAIGITRPSAVTWLDSDKFTYALGFLMLSMGLTLTVQDFKEARPRSAQPPHPPQGPPPEAGTPRGGARQLQHSHCGPSPLKPSLPSARVTAGRLQLCRPLPWCCS